MHEPDQSAQDTASDALRRGLLAAAGAAVPTSTIGRLGRTAAALLGRGGVLRSLRRGRGEPSELDPAALAKVVERFGRLKGIAMKVAQIMSYTDVALPPELREALAVLQTHAQPMTLATVQAVVRGELGARADALLAGMDPTPAAAASIGQVHRASLADGRDVAVKVQYPDIEKAIAADFGPAAFGSTMVSLVYPGARIDGFIQEARDRFLAECDYEAEARWQRRFGEVFADHPRIVVPEVHPELSARRVLTTTWHEGRRFEAFLASDPTQALRDELGEALFEFYIATLFRHGIYNCDPHPGNYLVTDDQRLVMLDYGCARTFQPALLGQLAALTRAVHADEPEALHEALLALGIVTEGKRYDRASARDLFRAFYGPMLEDRVMAFPRDRGMSMGDIARRKRELMKLALPGELLFLFRIRFGLVSVLARLGARANWCRLEQAALPAAARP